MQHLDLPDKTEYDVRESVSISSLTTASRCLRKLFYEKSGLKPQSGIAQDFGRALHHAIPTALSSGLNDSMDAFHEVWSGEWDEDGDKKRNPQRARDMLGDLVERQKEEFRVFDLVKPPTGLAPSQEDVSPWELDFSVDLGLRQEGRVVPFTGRVDSLATYRPNNGDLFAVEYKTSSEVSTRLVDNLSLSPQVVGYPYALRRLGLDVKGTLMVILRVSPSRTETAVVPVYVTDTQLGLFERWARWTGEWVLAAEREGTWPQNLGACSSYPAYGTPGWKCPFHALCHEVDDWRELAHEFLD